VAKSELGSVASLWRYPVKSMMGEELNAAEVGERGLAGDRAYALLDRETGKVASAKNPRKWPSLFEFSASYAEAPGRQGSLPPVSVAFPDGRVISTTAAHLDHTLSEELGREVALASSVPEAPVLEEYWPDIEGIALRETVTDELMPPGTFFDLALVHLLTTATIDRLSELYPEGRFEVRRFRPNIVVAVDEEGFVESDWVGRTLAIGDELRLSVTGPCPRCVMTTLAQGDLPKDPGILRTAAKSNEANVGIYASVLQVGTIRRGDPLRLV
jgi:uncharacterized protein YcbX